MELAREEKNRAEYLARRLSLAESSFKATLDVLYKCAQFFRDIVENHMGEAKQLTSLIEQAHDAAHSESYFVWRKALTAKLIVEAAN